MTVVDSGLLYAVKRLELSVRAQLDAMLADSPVTTLQYTALTVLEQRDAISAATLARRSFVTPQAMADMLRPLESLGLVERTLNPENRRERLVVLTPAGRDFLATHRAGADAIAHTMTTGLSPDQVTAFLAAISNATSALRAAGTAEQP